MLVSFYTYNKSVSAAYEAALWMFKRRPPSSGVNTSLGEKQEKQDCKVSIHHGTRVRSLKGAYTLLRR